MIDVDYFFTMRKEFFKLVDFKDERFLHMPIIDVRNLSWRIENNRCIQITNNEDFEHHNIQPGELNNRFLRIKKTDEFIIFVGFSMLEHFQRRSFIWVFKYANCETPPLLEDLLEDVLIN